VGRAGGAPAGVRPDPRWSDTLGRVTGVQPTPQRQRSTGVRVAAIVIGLALLVAFYIENRKKVKLSFIVFHHATSLSWLILVSSVLGFAIGWLVHGRVMARKGRRP
jgi:uncharacterized integral membrane protein